MSRSRRGAGGPKTPAGKAASAQNSRKHGLSLSAAADLGCARNIELLAQAIAGPDAGAERLAIARDVAAAEIEVSRIGAVRHAVLTRPVELPWPPTRDLAYTARRLDTGAGGDARVVEVLARLALRRAAAAWPPCRAIAVRVSELGRLERYERRARSRLTKAIRALDALAAEPGR